MDRKSFVIFLLASSLASSTFAGNLLNKLVPKHNLTHTSAAKTHKSAQDYTDFSGTWVANCGNGTRQTIVIENDENYISMDGNEVRIGSALNGLSESSETHNLIFYTALSWNADGSLTISSVNHDKDYQRIAPLFTLAWINIR